MEFNHPNSVSDALVLLSPTTIRNHALRRRGTVYINCYLKRPFEECEPSLLPSVVVRYDSESVSNEAQKEFWVDVTSIFLTNALGENSEDAHRVLLPVESLAHALAFKVLTRAFHAGSTDAMQTDQMVTEGLAKELSAVYHLMDPDGIFGIPPRVKSVFDLTENMMYDDSGRNFGNIRDQARYPLASIEGQAALNPPSEDDEHDPFEDDPIGDELIKDCDFLWISCYFRRRVSASNPTPEPYTLVQYDPASTTTQAQLEWRLQVISDFLGNPATNVTENTRQISLGPDSSACLRVLRDFSTCSLDRLTDAQARQIDKRLTDGLVQELSEYYIGRNPEKRYGPSPVVDSLFALEEILPDLRAALNRQSQTHG
ncbi:hypothetical protein TREMEDRAFT_62150 [Tremella mesenterica DSM 1558]|uniref:uncharacterized protein n=1 Tax=Tremella mesenterica (strain ATCC 24925 / CBS 8224 / DSM 1558 / NBRC 9311 / NRRL Y-6157 / RJB 2259-6 / UBC 559-6) TaxID=578456 RepID=UPI0003F4A04D|nr:uncharacterized protein TREMEDRAFT_62150 [Tremella mesenterica DSM 1558]EIW69287.1 hypothetical protein TREMEDRAFT_62150 [Tremella mesenterica DSM 1558]